MADIDNIPQNDACVQSFIRMNDDVRDLLNQLDREGQRGLRPAQEGSRQSKYVEGLYEIYVNGMLSNPRTIALNAASNVVPVATRIFDTLAAAAFSKLDWHSVDKVHFREAMAEASGIAQGAVDAFRFLSAVAKNPKTALEDLLTQQAIPVKLAEQAKVERTHRVITGANVNNAILKTATEWFGRSINIPGSALTTTDIFYKIIHYRAEVSKLAMRQVLNQGLQGADATRAYNEIRESIFAGRGNFADIDEKALASADLRTWTNQPEGTLNQWMAGSQDKGLVRWLVPFRRTMVNLFNYGLDSSPVGALKWLTDGAGVTNTKTGQALLKGGPERAEALGRMAVGTMTMTALWEIIGTDVDGDAPRNDQDAAHWRMNGHKEYTWKVGDRHIPLDAFGQFAPAMKALADTMTAMAQISYVTDPDADDKVMELAGTFVTELAEQFLDSHWVSSLSPFIEALNRFKNDDKNSWEPVQVFAGRMAANFVPFSGAVNQANKSLSDPYIHDLRGMKTELFAYTKARIVGLSDELPVKIDLWGNPMRYDAWQNPDLVDPISGKDEVYEAMKAVGTHIPISRREKHGVTMTPEEYQRFMVLSGQGVGNLPPLRDKLQQVMQSRVYNSFVHNSAKAAMLENVIQTYREAAGDFMAAYDPDFSERVKESMKAQQEQFRRQ